MSFLKAGLANDLRKVVKDYQKKLTNEEISESLYDVLRWVETMKKEGCDYCDRKAEGYITYEGLHRVCEKHRKIILELAGKGLIGIDFQRALEERSKNA